MPHAKQCPKCSGSMTEGFVADATHGSVVVSSWVEGAPRKSIWTGVRLTGLARSDISSWRCKSCGFLEQYAVAAPDRSHEAVQRKQFVLVLALAAAILLLILGAALLVRLTAAGGN